MTLIKWLQTQTYKNHLKNCVVSKSDWETLVNLKVFVVFNHLDLTNTQAMGDEVQQFPLMDVGHRRRGEIFFPYYNICKCVSTRLSGFL